MRASVSLLWVGLSLMSAGAQGDRAVVTVGPAASAPVIDGVLSTGEWDRAVAITGFLSPGAGAVAQPPTTAWLLTDWQALYVAFLCAEPDPGRPRSQVRDHDDHPWEDDSVQVFIAPEDLAAAGTARINFGGYAGAYDNWYSDIRAYYEFTVNGRGSRSEARNDVRDWQAPWSAHVSRSPGSWVAEMAIPWASLGVTQPPEGVLWGLNLFRWRQPDGMGWVFPGFGGYTPLPLGALCFRRDAPVVRQQPVTVPRLGANELTFAVSNPTDRPVSLAATVAAAAPVTRTVELPARGSAELRVPYELAGYGGLRARYAVKQAGTVAPLMAGFVPLDRPRPEQLSLRFYGLERQVEGTVTLLPETTAEDAVLRLHAAGGAPTEIRLALRGQPGGRLRLPLGGEPGQRYRAELLVRAADGRTLAQQQADYTTAARPAWLGTTAGLPLGVLPPWTPLKVTGTTIELLGKRVVYGDLALPAAIQTAGQELLAEPLRLVVVADGTPVRWRERTCRVVSQTPEQAQVESLWTSASVDLRVTATLEYDGFHWTQVRLEPHGRVTVQRLALEAPLRPARARYAYQGHAQACGALSPLGLRRPLSANLWVGDEDRGLAWLAESLDWLRSSDPGRQVEILPSKQATVWRTTLIDTPTELAAPYQAEFALHITPAKPVPLRKSRIFHGAYYGLEKARGGASLKLPCAGNLQLARGTLECWVKPDFDPAEVYDPQVDRSAYNRQLAVLDSGTGSGELLLLYYNADDRSFRIIKRDTRGQYPLVLGSPARLKPGWNYLALSWGERVRLHVNETTVTAPFAGSVDGPGTNASLRFDLGCYAVDELRLSATERPLAAVPDQPLTADAETLLLDHCDGLGAPERIAAGTGLSRSGCVQVPGRFGGALASNPETQLAQMAREGQRVVIFHENWARYQGHPDLAQVPRLKPLADACHQHGLLFLAYFCQLMSDAAPEWPALAADLMALPERCWYHRDDVKQDCYVSCVNGPYGELLLDGIAKLADQAGLDGVYMDGTTVPWDCQNPHHPGCGQARADGTYAARQPIRATRTFMKRLRNIFVQRRQALFLDAHTGGCINVATQSFCDGYYDGETLARYKPGFRMAPDTFLTGYTGRQFGFRGEFLPNRHSMDEALAISLVHDTATRGQPVEVDRAWADYEDDQTRFIGYWEEQRLFSVAPATVLGSLYLKPDRALLVLGSQTEAATEVRVALAGLRRRLPALQACDAISRQALPMVGGTLYLSMPPRTWRMIELRPPAARQTDRSGG